MTSSSESTGPSEPTGDGQAKPSDPASVPGEPTSDESSASASAAPVQPQGAETADPTLPPVDEGLPEWEPLTPELVEDEAIRGDFVIRWAVVGLALLFGFSQIGDTRTLVHIRSGEYLASHGVLPAANDVLSYTASDRRWVNLSWLFDLLVAGVHAVSGGIGLSIIQGVLAGVAFGLLAHAHRAEIRTWWGSICVVLALLVCYPQLTAQPELITLVGLAATLWLAFSSNESSFSKRLWLVVPVVWLWSQLDNRAFLGWLLLLAMAVGEGLRRNTDSAEAASSRRRLWWRVTGVAVAVAALHPFLWESWLSPIRLYFVDYPALRQIYPRPQLSELPFYSITSPLFWGSLNHREIAALVLFAATLVTLFLNRERLHPGHLLAVIVFNGLGGLTTHELAAASLVNCVVCAVNAQTWYRERFGQVYSVDWRELLFSRGGRAVTVLSFFALAWLVISGRIDGPGGKRTGIGFDDNLAVAMKDYSQATIDSFDDRPFHFEPRQGDLLIWAGRKSFVDSRAGLFAGAGDRDLLRVHDRTRRAIRMKREGQLGSGERTVWQATFDKYQITHAMPRLSGPTPPPDYVTLGDMLSSADWTLTNLTAVTGVFYRTDKNEEALKEFAKQHRLNFEARAFRVPLALTETTRDWAKPATAYDNLFSLRRPRRPAGVLTAHHHLQLAASSGSIPLPVRAACALLAVRHATDGLHEDPQSADGYHALGLSYLLLDNLESSIMAESKTQWLNLMRYYQATAALQQAAQLSPSDAGLQFDLLRLYQKQGRADLALETVRKIKKLLPLSAVPTEDEKTRREQLLDLELSLEETVARVEGYGEQQLQKDGDRYQVALAVYQGGAVRFAIRTVEEDAVYKEQNLAAKATLGIWLLEAGRVDEAHQMLEEVEQVAPASGLAGWHNSVAMSALSHGDYVRAIRLWRETSRETEHNLAQATLLTLPFLPMNPMAEQYPMAHAVAVGQSTGHFSGEGLMLTFQLAMAQLEMGDTAGATQSLRKALAHDSTSQFRPLLRFYLYCATEEEIPEKPAASEIKAEEFEPLDEEVAKKTE